MAYLTGLTRALTITGRAEEHQYRNYHSDGVHYSPYTDASLVTYLGTRQVSVAFRILTAAESGGSAGAWTIRWRITPQFIATSPYEGGSAYTSAPDVYTAWESYDGVHLPAAPVLFASDVTVEFTESSLLTQHAGAGGFGNTYETRNGIFWSGDYEAAFTVRVTHPGGGTSDVAFSASLTHTWTQTGSADQGVGAYQWQLDWPGGGGEFFDGSTLFPVPVIGSGSLPLGGAYQRPCGAACLIAADGLQYAATALSATCGGVQLTGDVTDAVLHNVNPELWINHNATDYFYGGAWFRAHFPQASVYVEPDWRAAVNAHDYPYDGVTAPLPTLNHWHSTGPTLRGTFSSPGLYYYPASGYYRRQTASVDPGDITVSASRGTTLSVDTLGAVIFDNGFRRDYGPPAHSGEVDTGPAIGDLNGNVFEVDEAWADGYGVLADSDNHVHNAKRYRFQASPAFDAFTLDVAPSHQFAWFDTLTDWSRQTDALFVADNPGYDAGVTLAIDSGALKVSVPTGPALVYTRNHLIARPYAYRWARLRFKTSAAGLRFRLWLDEIHPSGISLPRYAWDFTSETDDWEVQRWDTALPRWLIDPPPGSHTVARRDFTDVRHPVEGQQLPTAGLRVWVECLDPGDYWFDYVEGYHRPDLTIPEERLDRTPLTVLYPEEVRGQEAGPFTATGPVPFTIHVLRAITNGVRSMDFVYQYSGSGGHPTIRTFWNGIKTNFTDGDTGVTLTPAASDPTTTDLLPIVAAGDIEAPLPMGKEITPGTGRTFKAREKLSEIWAHYGMGDPVARAYGATIMVHIERIWDGELAGNIHDNWEPAPDVAVNLLDNDSETVLRSAGSDADGLYRLLYRYGSADPYANTPRGGTLTARHPAVGSALWRQLNAWWLQGEDLTEDKDAEDVLTDSSLTTRLTYPILERWDNWVDLVGVATIGSGVDLVETSPGWLFRTYRQSATIYVERSRDGGHTWDPRVVVATDAAPDAVPSITRDAWDTLYVWYQASDLTGQGYYSEDWGATWTSYASHPAMGFPRLLVLPDRQLLAYFNGDVLAVDQSDDWGATLTTAVTFGAQPVRPFVFKADRFGIPHLVYEDSTGALLHRYSEDPMRFGSWSASAVLVAAGSFPGWGMGIHDGYLVYFTGSTPHAALLTETGDAVAASAAAPSSLSPAGSGVIVTRNDYAYIAGRAGGVLVNRYSPDAGAHWSTP